MLVFWFFFFKQKTAYEMRISDWSSDVCSSDLPCRGRAGGDAARAGTVRQARPDADALAQRRQRRQGTGRRPRADRKSVVEGKGVSVRVERGGRRIIKK